MYGAWPVLAPPAHKRRQYENSGYHYHDHYLRLGVPEDQHEIQGMAIQKSLGTEMIKKATEVRDVVNAWDKDLLRITCLDGGKITETKITITGSLTYNALQKFYAYYLYLKIVSNKDYQRKSRLEKRWQDIVKTKGGYYDQRNNATPG